MTDFKKELETEFEEVLGVDLKSLTDDEAVNMLLKEIQSSRNSLLDRYKKGLKVKHIGSGRLGTYTGKMVDDTYAEIQFEDGSIESIAFINLDLPE